MNLINILSPAPISPKLQLPRIQLNLLEINNLDELVKLKYPHICLNVHNLMQFTQIPEQEKKFYPLRSKRYAGNKWGFFNNGDTTCWYDYNLKCGEIKIAFNMPKDTVKGWSDVMEFSNEGDPLKIYKFMKLKVFW